jgi:signal transduction histidine kinase
LTELDQGRPGEVEYRLTRRDGAVIWVRDSARVEDRENARIIYGVINDITARKETEAAIVRYSERLEILRQIEQGILSAQSVAEIGQSAMSRIRRLIPCHSATVTMFDDKANEAIVIAGEGEKPGQPVGLRRARFIQSGHPKERFNMLKQGEIIMLDEADLVRDYENVHNRSIRSVMVVPLLHQDDLVGTLNLSATKAGVFTPEHREIAHQVAGQLAIAIRQADLHAQTQQHAAQLEQRVADRVRELSALYEVTALASQAVELPVMLAQALEQILAAVRSEVGLIWLSNGEAQQRFHLAAQQGLSGEALGQVEVEMKEQGWLNQVAGQKQPLILPNLTQLPSNFPASLQAFVGLPIQAGGQIWGVFTIFGCTPRQFNLEDVALLTSVADQIGVAMENSRLRQQAREAAVMAERERLARDLHDSVTQSLYSLGLFAESGLEEVNSGHIEPARHYLTRIGETTQQALKEMRLMIYELRPADLERLGLVGALHRRLAAVEKRSGITARLFVEELIELPLPIEQEFYGIIQEALNNILKHAQATQVDVHLRRVEDMVELTISDNGQGFDPDGVETGGGLGLNGIRERVKMIDGTLTIHSAPAKGTIIEVQVKFSQT